MKQLVDIGLDKTAFEAKVKDDIGVATHVAISSAVQAVPQAALAWTGICLVLEVSSFGNRHFVC
jgi:hypothetical protein